MTGVGYPLALVWVTAISVAGILGQRLITWYIYDRHAARRYECARCGYQGRTGVPLPHPADCDSCRGHPKPGYTCAECGRYQVRP